jgi:MGT family glycosyltransferase
MAKALIFVVPGHGHIHPTLPVVQELVARGEEVVYYTTESFVPQIRETGAKVQIYTSIISQLAPSFMAQSGNSAGGPAQGISFFMIDETQHVLPQILEHARAEKADYAIYDTMCLWGKMAAQLLELPAMTFRPSYVMNEHFSMRQQMAGRFPRPQPEMLRAMQEKLADLGMKYGIELPQNPFSIMMSAEPLNIVFLPRAFQPAGETFDERFVFVGPAIMRRNDAEEVAKQLRLEEDARPLILISLGTVFNQHIDFFQNCFKAFGNEAVRVILAYGSRIERASLGSIPENFQAFSYVPQLEILQKAAAFVTHGGMNSTMEGLYYGVPLVVVPQMGEQAITARRVAELQLGLALEPEQLTVEGLRDAVKEVIGNPLYKEQAKGMQGEIQRAGGYKRAAEAILNFRKEKG